ncbi:eukaryotic translation initiation factor 3 subunit A [Cercophora scortea]|uniref:Eukaryotic translation initiation factor 3 subunit A n=1 Tax=Cercophora scortea TaxID=314031 RepID=A0AAE0J0N2_9PEZI|nr:eukaryotic translation initiation factor 3 subunit A [Cercophora scortea]
MAPPPPPRRIGCVAVVHHPPPPHQKPENVLKRAHELIGVNQASAALTLLHEHITSKRSRNVPIASLEPVMVLLVELSVEQKKGKLAKDALYQYKNIAQNTNVGTIELVLKKFIELAAEKVTAAQAKADEVQSTLEATAGAASVEDLEASETPESILLATVSGEQSRDRTDRAIVTPWLKFLWEAYRTVLDILRNNARLEILYQSTAMQAFDFCLKYARKTEFRRLCELLRNHVQTAAKYSAQMHAINLNDPDTLQRHLETRFQQLNVAVELELWQEAFRSVEDIHTLLNLSKRPAKNIMMANYYEKLTRIFLVGENYLFHAAAWSRYYNLLRQSAALVATGQSKKADNPPSTEADLQKAATFVILSALSIPVISTSRSRGAMVDFDEARKNKNSRLTHLLGMSQAPSRAGLFRDALSKSLLRRARPQIRDLYNILEQVILTRLFQQLSQVYETVDLEFVESLAQFPEPFQVTRGTVEKFIMNGNKKGDLAIRMDHATGVLSFDADVFSSAKAAHAGSGAGSAEAETGSVQRLQSTPSQIVRSQLTRLADVLYTTCRYIDPSFNEARIKARNIAFTRAKLGAEKEHLAVLARKDIIQKRKEKASEAQAQKEKELARKKLLQEAALQQAEANRLAEEQKIREQKRMATEREQIKRKEVETMLKDMKLDGLEGEDIDSLDSNKIRMIKLQQLEREKNTIAEKLRITGKRLDHLERAFRKEEAKKLPEDYERQRARDLAAYELVKAQTLKEAEQKHKDDVELKHRLARLVPLYESFRANLHERRRDEFEKRRRDADRELEKQISARQKEYREKKLREKREREERERALQEAEERAAREKEEERQRLEARREEMAKRKEEMEKEREKAKEIAARQLQREEEAMARRKAEKAASLAAPLRREIPERSESSGPPRLQLAGKNPTWREREAAARASGQAPTDTTPPAAAPARAAAPIERAPIERAPIERAPIDRTDSGERASGPPRLALAGSKPTWRDREAAKASGGAPAAAPAERPAPVPRVSSGRGIPIERASSGRGIPIERASSGRFENARDGKDGKDAAAAPPAEPLKPSGAPGKYVPKFRRGGDGA